MPTFNVDTDDLVKYTNKLEKLRKFDFPVAVMQTLNSAAFDVKQKTMPITSKSFVNRTKNFFKANSTVMRANGLKVAKMKSEVGFFRTRLRGDGNPSDNYSTRDLKEQEHGGRIQGKSFIPLDAARKSGRNSLVKAAHRITRVKNIVNQKRFKGSKKQQFIKAVHAAGKGGYVLGGTEFGSTTLFKVNALNKKGKFRVTPLYDYKKNRSVKVKPTGFMRIASEKSSTKMDIFYIKHAKARFEKALMV